MKALVIKNIELPEDGGFIDIRVYGNGMVFLPGEIGEGSETTAEEIEIDE